jgi:biotin carboxylase
VPNPVSHLLVVGGGRSVPELARKFRPDVQISAVCGPGAASGFPDLGDFLRLVTIADGAPAADWIDAALYVNAVEPVDGLVVINERDLENAAAIGAKLGLPAPSPATATAVNNKEVMRSVLRSAGVDDTPARVVTSASDIAAFGKEAGYPVICKPLAGIGSRGISRINREDDIDSALAYTRSGTGSLQSDAVMIEKFHVGAEYSVESISEDSRHLIACITAKHSDPVSFVELGHVLPAEISRELADDITATVRAALDALGVQSGITHTEVIVTAGRTHIIETHLRPAGDRIPEMLNRVRSIDLIALLVEQALGFPVLDEAQTVVNATAESNRYAAIWYASPAERGRVLSVDGTSEAEAVPGVYDVKIKTNVGGTLRDLENSDSRAAFVTALGESSKQALDRARAGAGMLRFKVDG